MTSAAAGKANLKEQAGRGRMWSSPQMTDLALEKNVATPACVSTIPTWGVIKGLLSFSCLRASGSELWPVEKTLKYEVYGPLRPHQAWLQGMEEFPESWPQLGAWISREVVQKVPLKVGVCAVWTSFTSGRCQAIWCPLWIQM